MYEHGDELFLSAVPTGKDYPASVKLWLPVDYVDRGFVAVPAPENIVCEVYEPAHDKPSGKKKRLRVKGEMGEKVSVVLRGAEPTLDKRALSFSDLSGATLFGLTFP